MPAGPPGPTLGTHLKRAFDWNLAEIVVTPKEQQQLAAAGVEPRMQGLFAWRRSTLLVALPLLLLSVVLSFVQAGQTELAGYTELGKLINWLPPIALAFVPLGAVIVIRNWTVMQRSSKTMIICWVISIAIPLLVALVPLDYVLDIDGQRQIYLANGYTNDDFNALVFISRLRKATVYALTLLPVVLSVPGGVIKGAGRAKSLFPSASLPGWFLVAVAPFYSMFMIVVFVLIDQIMGNGLLLLGVGLLAFTPWLFVINRRVYGRPLASAEAPAALARVSRPGGILTILGVSFVAIYMLTGHVQKTKVLGGDENKAYFTYVQVLRTLGEVFARSLVTTVVFSTIFVYLVFAEWRTMTQMHGGIKQEHDEQMRALQRYIDDRPAQATWATGPAS